MRVSGRPADPASVFASPAVFRSSDYQPLAVTVPAPTVAPTLVSARAYTGLVAGSSYEIAYTYEGYSGETQLSPATTFVSNVDGSGIAALPIAALGTKAVSARFYIRKDGGTYRRADHGYQTVAARQRCGFGDEGPYGGVILNYNAAGGTAPGSNTALDSDGTTAIANPTVAPPVFAVGGLAQSTTYYVAFSYEAADGTETALSPVASIASTTGGSQFLQVSRSNIYVPSGACFVRLYLGLSAGALKFQKKIPLHFVTAELHEYNAAGVANSPGAAQTTLSPLQRMIDAMLQIPGSIGYHPLNAMVQPHPTIIRATNAAGAPVGGFRLIGMSGDDLGGNSTRSRVIYTGPVGGECLVFSGNSWHVEGMAWADPNDLAKYGWAGCDSVGSGGFLSQWDDCSFSAGQADSRGLIVSCQSGVNMGNHTASEQWFRRCTIGGNWAVDLHGNQTVNFRFVDSIFGTRGANGANSGEVRIAVGLASFHGTNQNGRGQYVYYLTTDGPHAAQGDPSMVLDGGYLEMYEGRAILYVSGLTMNPVYVTIAHSALSNHTGGLVYAICAHGPLVAHLAQNVLIAGDVLLNDPSAVIIGSGRRGLAPANQKAVSPDYTAEALSATCGAIVLRNESGQVSTLRTNAAGQIILAQASAPVLSTSATLAETIAALQAAGLVRQS